MEPKKTAAALFDDPSRPFILKLWDGTRLATPSGAKGSLVLKRPEIMPLLVPPIDEDEVTDAFAQGDIDIEGNTIDVLESLARWRGPRHPARALGALPSAWLLRAGQALRKNPLNARLTGRRRSIDRDGAAVRHHYDVSRDFYRLFLDEQMVYSCAVFPRGDETLEDAQRLKLEWICQKLDVREGDRFLDVGCGWGALISHAARERKASSWGTTVSRDQFLASQEKAAASGGSIQVLDRDYRRLPEETFDKIASVGMMEHVGADHLDTYFGELARRLRPGGLFLNHAIADTAQGARIIPWLRRRGGGFLHRCIFPDSEMPSIGVVLEAAERCGLEVLDVELLRDHYVRTLAHWLHNLEAHMDEAAALVGITRARTWRLYFAASAVAFRLGSVGVYQTLLGKRDGAGRIPGAPRWRGAWYENGFAANGNHPQSGPSPIAADRRAG